MNIVYIQDQETECFKGDYYHSKSEHFFERYLAGLNEEDTLTVYCGVIEVTDEERIKKCKKVSHPRIRFEGIPEFRKIKNLFSIHRQMKDVVKDADFCYLRSGIASSIAGYYCRKYGVPYMAIMNEDVFKNLLLHPNKIFKLFAYPISWMVHNMVKKADYACYVTQDYLQGRYPCKGLVCGCSDIEFLDINGQSLENRISRIKNTGDEIILGSVGSVSALLKGQDTVIKALADLKKKGINKYRYELVGTGNPERLQHLAKQLGVADLVDFRGAFSHDDVLKWFENIDIYIHPSHSEGLPRTILEAMTKATPCICTRVGGVPELISEEWLFEYNGNEVTDLVNLIIKMDSQKMKNQAQVNFEKSKGYNPEILEKRRSKFFCSAIENTRKQK